MTHVSDGTMALAQPMQINVSTNTSALIATQLAMSMAIVSTNPKWVQIMDSIIQTPKYLWSFHWENNTEGIM
jgi:hypothetical protein